MNPAGQAAGPASLPQELLWKAFDAADVGLLITGPDRRILYVNATFTRETGYTLSEVQGRNCAFLQGPGTDPEDIQAMRDALDRGEGFSRVVLNYRKDGTPLHYRVRVSPVYDAGVLRCFVGVQEDYTDTHLAQRRLERWAYVDSLTGLGNRRAFDQAIDEALAQRAALRLILIDLNDFKIVNDQRGHQAGDELLIAVAECLTGLVNAPACPYRLGGDEFAVLLPAGQGGLENLLERQLSRLDGGRLRVSVGSASFPDEALNASELFRLADQRMYARKRTHVSADTDRRGGWRPPRPQAAPPRQSLESAE